MKAAICVGHNRHKKGAFSKRLNSTEFDYNNRVAQLVSKQIDADIYYRENHNSYTEEIKHLASRVNQKKYDIVFELHFNSYNGEVNGVEALYYKNSVLGVYFAEAFCEAVNMEYGSKIRGAKPLINKKENGFGFVKHINAPAIILEPFFGDNEEASKFINAQRYADTIVKWLKCL